MKASARFDALVKKFHDDSEFIAEGLLLDINEQLMKLIHKHSLSQSALAQRLGVSNAYVSKLLNGNENLTIKQLVKIAVTLGCTVDVAFIPKPFTVNRLLCYTPSKVDVRGFHKQFNVKESHEPNLSIAA
jgi:transcriptional regulator with XRE-family HTH domain